MKRPLAFSLAIELMTHHGLMGDWIFTINDRMLKNIARCDFDDHTISMAGWFIDDHSVSPVRDTILHEIAHALAGYDAGHGPLWVERCIELGCQPNEVVNYKSVVDKG